ncbi:hypothetical protein ACFSHS_06135, partial [Blastococcus deserti]
MVASHGRPPTLAATASWAGTRNWSRLLFSVLSGLGLTLMFSAVLIAFAGLASADGATPAAAPSPDPAMSDPAMSDPAMSDPAMSDPAMSDPAMSDPATSQVPPPGDVQPPGADHALGYEVTEAPEASSSEPSAAPIGPAVPAVAAGGDPSAGP